MTFDPKQHSRVITDGHDRAGARAMLKGIGFTDDDLARPIIGVANTWTETMPCNYHLRRLAVKVKEGIRAAGGTPMEFNTIAISDGVTMGTEGMKASLVSREVIANSIELVGRGHMFDAIIALVGCDKTIPGAAMALIRLDVPGLILYGGSIAPGRFRGKERDGWRCLRGNRGLCSGQDERRGPERAGKRCLSRGRCVRWTVYRQYHGDDLGVSWSLSDGHSERSRYRPAQGWSGPALWTAHYGPPAAGSHARDILTRQAFENAIAGVASSGGSTNAVLHLLALAREVGIPLTIDDFDAISRRTPLLADLKPGGRYVAVDLDQARGSAATGAAARYRRLSRWKATDVQADELLVKKPARR